MTKKELRSKLIDIGFDGHKTSNSFIINFGSSMLIEGHESITVLLYEDNIVGIYASRCNGFGLSGVNGPKIPLEELTDKLLLESLCDISQKFLVKNRKDKIDKILKL